MESLAILVQVRKTRRGHCHIILSLFLLFHTTIKIRRFMLLLRLIDHALFAKVLASTIVKSVRTQREVLLQCVV